MEHDAGRGLDNLKTMDGKESENAHANGSYKAVVVPNCCLKARVYDPELEANCHSTVVSGWFSQPQRPSSGHYQNYFVHLLRLIDFFYNYLT